MTINTVNDYWISPNALFIERNVMGLPDYLQAGCVSDAHILVYIKGIIEYDAGHNYRRWPLMASPTVFTTHTRKYVYVAIPRPATAPDASPSGNAMVVFPSEHIDIYGQNEEGEQIGSEDYYYIFLQGILTSSGDNGTVNRRWEHEVETGKLSSDEAVRAQTEESEWFRYCSDDGVVTFLKNLTMKATTAFANLYAHTVSIITGGSITFEEGGTVSGIAKDETSLTSADKIVTPAYAETQWVSKTHADTISGEKTFNDIVTVQKNLITRGNLGVAGAARIQGATQIGGNVSIGTPSPGTPADTQHWGGSTWGAFVKGILAGTGAQIDQSGNAELESLVVRRFLEVPELRYNRVSIHSGTDWFTKGSGLIESVERTDDTHGTIHLHLEDGEYGTAAADDLCMGIFHNISSDAKENIDDHKGILQYRGFTTVYFRITAVRGKFSNILDYEIRPASAEWQGQIHPQPQMTFACYANPNDTTRQASVLRTTDYTVYLEKMNSWSFGPDNYYLIMGQLDGFSVWAANKAGTRYLKALTGNGIMLGNAYMFGNIDQFDRLADTVEVTAQPLRNADFSLDDGDTMTLHFRTLSWSGEAQQGATYTIERNSGDSEADEEWNAAHSLSGSTCPLTKADLRGQKSVEFTVSSTRNIPSGDTEEPYTVTRSIVVHSVAKDGTPGTPGTDAVTYQIDLQRADFTKGTTGISAQIALRAYKVVGNRREEITTWTPVPIICPSSDTEDRYVPDNLPTSAYAFQYRWDVEGLSLDEKSIIVFIAPNPATPLSEALYSVTVPIAFSGTDGYNGCLIRRSEWEAGKQYRNDSDRTVADPVTGQYIIDEVTVSDYNGGDGYTYLCRQTHISTADNKPRPNATTSQWQILNNQQPIRASFADIQRAVIGYLQTKQIVIETTPEGATEPVPYGAFGGGRDDKGNLLPPLWFGGTTPEKAKVRFGSDGDGMVASGNLAWDGQGNIAMRSSRLETFDPAGRLLSSYNENGDGLMTYYYATLETTDPDGNLLRIKMKEDAFMYDDSGAIRGLQTRYFDTDGSLKWYINELGETLLAESYWEFFSGGEWHGTAVDAEGNPITVTAIAVYYHKVNDGTLYRYNNAIWPNNSGNISQSSSPSTRPDSVTYIGKIISADGRYIIHGETQQERIPGPFIAYRAFRYNTVIRYVVNLQDSTQPYTTNIIIEKEYLS